MLKKQADYLKTAFEAFRPPAHPPIDRWIEDNIILPGLTCPEPGPMRISRTPYIRGPLQAFASLYVEHIVLVWGRQLGKSQGVIYPSMAYGIAEDPGPALFLLPSNELGKYTSEKRIQPMFNLCRAITGKRTADQDDYTCMEMQFIDSVLSIAGAGSGSQVMTRPVRYLYRDEIDEFKVGVGQDATDPMKSSEETTSNFANRKIIDTSTPTKLTGNIWRGLEACHFAFELWILCPHCSAEFTIQCYDRDGQLCGNIDFYGETDPESAATVADLRCPHCGAHTKNHQKPALLERAEWRARTSENPCRQIRENVTPNINETVSLADVLEDAKATRVGFHLPKWYSPFAHGTYGACVKEFMEAQGDYLRMSGWSKFWAARPYIEQAEGTKIEETSAHIVNIAPGICPDDTIAVTMGIDPGQRGFWWTSWAWLPQHINHLIAYGHISLVGMAMDEQIELYRSFVFDTRYISSTGNYEYPIWRAAMDTGGGKTKAEPMTQTAKAYAIVRGVVRAQMKVESDPHLRAMVDRRILATKGDTTTDKSMRESRIDKGPDGKPIPGGLTLWIMNVNLLKSAFSYAFNLEPGKQGSITLNNGRIDEFIAHISAEELQQNNRQQWEWVQRPKTENHLLDCTVGALGAGASECEGGVSALKRPQRMPIKIKNEEKPPEEAKANEPLNIEPPQTPQKPPQKHTRPRRMGWFRR